MRAQRILSAALVLGLFVVCSATLLNACGDKLLVLVRGVDFDKLSVRYKASLIAYAPAALSPTAAVNDSQLHAALKKAGHKLRLVQDGNTLSEALRSGRYDLVLVDPTDAAAIERQVSVAGVNTVIMPVVYEGDPQLNYSDSAHPHCIRKTLGKDRTCLSTIDKAIELKRKRDEQQTRAGK